MKILIYLLGVIAIAACGLVDDNGTPYVVNMCYRQVKFDGDKLEDFSWANKQFTCFHACMMEHRGEMENGKINLEKYIENHMIDNNERVKDKSKLQIIECTLQANNHDDKCAVAGSMGKCVTDKWHLIVKDEKSSDDQ